jgi:hypothetical protein
MFSHDFEIRGRDVRESFGDEELNFDLDCGTSRDG